MVGLRRHYILSNSSWTLYKARFHAMTYVHHPHGYKEVVNGQLIVVITVKLPEEIDNSGMVGPQPQQHSVEKTKQQLFSLWRMFLCLWTCMIRTTKETCHARDNKKRGTITNSYQELSETRTKSTRYFITIPLNHYESMCDFQHLYTIIGWLDAKLWVAQRLKGRRKLV